MPQALHHATPVSAWQASTSPSAAPAPLRGPASAQMRVMLPLPLLLPVLLLLQHSFDARSLIGATCCPHAANTKPLPILFLCSQPDTSQTASGLFWSQIAPSRIQQTRTRHQQYLTTPCPSICYANEAYAQRLCQYNSYWNSHLYNCCQFVFKFEFV